MDMLDGLVYSFPTRYQHEPNVSNIDVQLNATSNFFA